MSHLLDLLETKGVRYVLAGVWNTAFGILTFGALLSLFQEQIGYIGVLTVTTPITILQAHLVQRKFVWKSKAAYAPELYRFSSVYFGQYVLNALLLLLFVEVFEIPVFRSQLLASFVLVIVTFYINRKWTFSKK